MATTTTPEVTPKIAPINLTPNAIKKVKEIMGQQNPVPTGLRVGVVGGGCSGFSYSMQFENGAGMMDKVFDMDGLKVYVDATSLMYLKRLHCGLPRDSRRRRIQIRESRTLRAPAAAVLRSRCNRPGSSAVAESSRALLNRQGFLFANACSSYCSGGHIRRLRSELGTAGSGGSLSNRMSCAPVEPNFRGWVPVPCIPG